MLDVHRSTIRIADIAGLVVENRYKFFGVVVVAVMTDVSGPGFSAGLLPDSLYLLTGFKSKIDLVLDGDFCVLCHVDG